MGLLARGLCSADISWARIDLEAISLRNFFEEENGYLQCSRSRRNGRKMFECVVSQDLVLCECVRREPPVF